jgi:hypothetical protein
MVMAENCHTPVSFWLQLPLNELLLWINDNNEIIKDRMPKK